MLAGLYRFIKKHLICIFNRASIANRDAALISAYADVLAAEAAMTVATDPATRDRILSDRWAPAYATACSLPAYTLPGLGIKVRLLLDEHENGASEWGKELRKTTASVLAAVDENT